MKQVNLATIENQTEETHWEALEAVKQDWLALRYIRKQTEEMASIALKQDKRAARYVRI